MAVRSTAANAPATPSRPTLRVHYASFESRVAAGILDVFVLVIIAAILATAGSLVVLISSDFERTDNSDMSLYVFYSCIGAILPAYLLYFFISYAWKGQTVGAAVMQIMVIRSDGRPLGVLGSVARVVGLLAYVLILTIGIIAAVIIKDSTYGAAGAVGLALVLSALGLLWAAFDSRRRTLHDRVAGTVVVRIA
jgi:uncharacterized RDD family membrane protein YckC